MSHKVSYCIRPRIMLRNIPSVACVVALMHVVLGQGGIGDICTLKTNGQKGKCVVINDCPVAVSQILKERRFPERCGEFVGNDPIICCPETSTRVTGVVSEEKCREYSKYIYSRRRPPILLVSTMTHVKNECGFKAIPLVVGGTNVTRKEFPHMALIGFESSSGEIKWQCGGSIISEQFILTAAHCTYSREYNEAKHVLMGVTSLTDLSYRQEHRIMDRIVHPNYKPPENYNDIALIKLEAPARMTPYARPACLSRELTTPPNGRAIATGWGKTHSEGSASNDLLKVVLEYTSREKCNKWYSNNAVNTRRFPNGINDENQLCAGTFDDTPRDTCQGDSGGPLQIYHTSDNVTCMYDIVGVTSFGKTCGLGKSSGVYTRVANYIKWIEDVVWPEVESNS